MADIDLDIKNLPDDTYSVWLRRNSDGVEQFKSTLSFVGGLATAALSTAVDGDYIEGAIFGNNNPAVRGAVVSGYAYGATWILASGVWSDSGVWDDAAIWNDGV